MAIFTSPYDAQRLRAELATLVAIDAGRIKDFDAWAGSDVEPSKVVVYVHYDHDSTWHGYFERHVIDAMLERCKGE